MPETASLKNGIAAVGFQIVIPGGRFKKNRNLSARSCQPRRPGFGKQPHRGKIDPFEHHNARTPPRRDLPQFIAETQRRRTARRRPQQAFGQRNPVAQQTQFVDERQRAVRRQRIGSHTDIQPVRPQQLHRRAQSRDIPVRTRAEAPPHGCREVRRHAVDRPLRHTAIVDEQHAARGRDAPDEPFDRRAVMQKSHRQPRSAYHAASSPSPR